MRITVAAAVTLFQLVAFHYKFHIVSKPDGTGQAECPSGKRQTGNDRSGRYARLSGSRDRRNEMRCFEESNALDLLRLTCRV
jgi:hypothetical protein